MGFFTTKKAVTKHYKFEKKELGSGNFAKVYLAKTVKPGVQESGVEVPASVAIKVIDKKKVEDMNDITREIEIMEECRHPNIIRLYEIFDEKEKMNLVMELVTGGELFDEIVARGSFTEKDAANVIGTLCSALQYLHAKKIVHRDLKPENILMSCKKEELPPGSTEPSIKVADFGLARLVSDKDMMRTACGTPGYVAPEVLKNKGYSSGAVDLWSAGVILYILLCGFPPFYAEGEAELVARVRHGHFEFTEPYWNNISKNAKDLICQCLSLRPGDRPTPEEALSHAWLLDAAAAPPAAQSIRVPPGASRAKPPAASKAPAPAPSNLVPAAAAAAAPGTANTPAAGELIARIRQMRHSFVPSVASSSQSKARASLQLTLEDEGTRFGEAPSRQSLQSQGATFVKLPRALFQDLYALCDAQKRGTLPEGGEQRLNELLRSLSTEVQQGNLGKPA
uniref:Protein kinase domain-containing protein n=1 Tax=Haptolina brevifila TaxID=156173 RepID=A0A7S2CGZ2_9EUKA|mmetsp:Transcript_23976/g.47936  ORF Transcript_23976/g.47936 Transcript_23976/m.47936 type:complete len:452 (+) Transcript_23976:78-1433(+)